MKILLVGDSHTFGTYGQNLERMLKEAGHEVVRVGWVGAAAHHYLNGTQEKLKLGGTGDFAKAKAGTYDVVVVSLGTNDAAGWDAPVAAQSIRKLITSLVGTKKLWVGPPAFSDNAAKTYNRAFAVKDLNTRTEELYAAMRDGADYSILDPRDATKPFVLASDIHLGPKGGKAWASFVTGALTGVAPAAPTAPDSTGKPETPPETPSSKKSKAPVLLIAAVIVAGTLFLTRRGRS